MERAAEGVGPYYLVTTKLALATSSVIRLAGDAGCHLLLQGKAFCASLLTSPRGALMKGRIAAPVTSVTGAQ